MTEDRDISSDPLLGSIGSCFYRYIPNPRGAGFPLAQDKGAAYFNRLEGMWTEPGESRIYFDTTEGGDAGLGQVWEYHPGRETLRLVFESSSSAELQNPDNVVVVPQTGHIFLQEDDGEQFVRGITRDGEIYDFVNCK